MQWKTLPAEVGLRLTLGTGLQEVSWRKLALIQTAYLLSVVALQTEVVEDFLASAM